MRYQTFTVRWRGHFPLDMLRYDSCFPADQEAVNTIQRSLTEPSPGVLAAKLARHVRTKKATPTLARWASFLCAVEDVETR